MDDERKTSDHSPDLNNFKQVRHHFSPPSLYEQLKQPQLLAQAKRARQDERIQKSFCIDRALKNEQTDDGISHYEFDTKSSCKLRRSNKLVAKSSSSVSSGHLRMVFPSVASLSTKILCNNLSAEKLME